MNPSLRQQAITLVVVAPITIGAVAKSFASDSRFAAGLAEICKGVSMAVAMRVMSNPTRTPASQRCDLT
jgi:hypothetical protein